MVLASDDPGMMRYVFTADFYVACVAWDLDLKALKRLAMNSLSYSALSDREKESALESWNKKWEAYIAWLTRY